MSCLSSAGNAQEGETTRQGTDLNPRAPLFWADGITQIADLDAYQRTGFNTVIVRLTWQATAGGEISAVNLVPQRNFAEAAAKRGMRVIYALPAAPTGLDGAFRLAADSEAYIALWTTWLQGAIATMRDTPNLVGWMLPDDPRGLPIYDDIGFQRWLGQNYASQAVINRQWNANFRDLDDVSIGDVGQLVDTWRGAPKVDEKDVNSGAREVVRPTFGRDWAFHPAALALAQYKWDAYRALLTAWVGAIRGEDNSHLVLSGRTPDYAQLLSFPAGIDIAVPDMSPGVAEDDIVTHNPQGIDIARRGGKFGVMPVLSPRQSPQLPVSALPDLTRRWIDEAWSHGSKGIGFDDWNDLRKVPGLPLAINGEFTKLSRGSVSAVWGSTPVNTTAVLLTPLADGATLLFGAPPAQFPRGLYGFGEDLVNGEPSNLVWALRWGTAFGGVDYLSPDDLGEATLDRYTTILAPQALSATGDTTSQLSEYVAAGGILISDLGIGALQNGGQVNALPPPVAALFGVPTDYDVRFMNFNLNGVTPHQLLPTWGKQIEVRPGVPLTIGDGLGGMAFNGPVGLSPVQPGAQILATGPRVQEAGGGNRIFATQLTINSVGRGYAIYAPFRLWNSWRPGHAGFDTFLGEIISRGSTVVMSGASSMVPSPATAAVGQPLYPEIVNHATGLTLTNHSAADTDAQLAAVQTSGAGDWLWSGAMVHFPANDSFPVASGRRAPIEDATEFEARPHTVALYDVLPFGEAHNLTMRPIAVQNRAGGPVAAVIEEETEARLKLGIWPNAPSVVSKKTEWQSILGEAAPVRVTLVTTPDSYQAMPGSKHRAVIVDYSKSTGKNKFLTTEKVAVTGADGRLIFEFTGVACEVTITPMT
ncbi:hypothetical protein EON80_05530 [bacterium]|nr:MAG: hypothetical protein EON80_05530 [bacterium]